MKRSTKDHKAETVSDRDVKRREFFVACAAGAASTWAASSQAHGQTRQADADGPAIDGDFPGGNIIVERIDGDDVYWYFRVRRAAATWPGRYGGTCNPTPGPPSRRRRPPLYSA